MVSRGVSHAGRNTCLQLAVLTRVPKGGCRRKPIETLSQSRQERGSGEAYRKKRREEEAEEEEEEEEGRGREEGEEDHSARTKGSLGAMHHARNTHP